MTTFILALLTPFFLASVGFCILTIVDEAKYKIRQEVYNKGYDAGYSNCEHMYGMQLKVQKEILAKSEEKNRNEWVRGYGDAQAELFAAMKKHPKIYQKFIKDFGKKECDHKHPKGLKPANSDAEENPTCRKCGMAVNPFELAFIKNSKNTE